MTRCESNVKWNKYPTIDDNRYNNTEWFKSFGTKRNLIRIEIRSRSKMIIILL